MAIKPNVYDPLEFATEKDRLALYDDRPATLRKRGRIILAGAGIVATAAIGISGGQGIIKVLKNNPNNSPAHLINPNSEQSNIVDTGRKAQVSEVASANDASGIVVPSEKHGGRYGNETFSYNPDEVPAGYAEKLKEVYPDINP